jgi:5-methylcytosine-specific restriction endonuclease McrA
MRKSMELSRRTDQELLSDIATLVGSHRDITAKLVLYLAEIEERRLHLQAGFSSMFEFCVKKLGLGEGEAFRRIVAARLGKRFPAVYSLLASGAVHLSSLELLSKRLTEENHAELLEAASGKSKREVEALLAARFPRPAVPSSIQRLPVPAAAPASGGSGGSRDSSSTPAFMLEPTESARAHVPASARVEQLSEARFRVEFTASGELREKLELCRDLLSHANPSRDLAGVIERAVDSLLVRLEKKRLARTKRPRPEQAARKGRSRRIANAVRRRVFERDGLRCTYVSPDGRRCEARAFLELDHADPRALGGSDKEENLRVRCRAHNQLWAEQTYGREHVEDARNFRQKKWERPRDDGRSVKPEKPATNGRSVRPEKPATNGVSPDVLEKVRLALQGMGFRDAQARRAVAEVGRAHSERLPVEQALREALFFATARSA